ncbi:MULTISPECIES: ComF family protein [Pseudarthrobacter]|uniref:Amidophosphoribosyltransferase n=2 Tax=Pseudarthrobacter TaxID=1742993 RepID=A0AAJ1SQ06_9MICC|nr:MULTISPECIES: phosphoribosyltransferase family protein [Pseudarthrobacter]MDQ0144926.1 putative amidophosphoribosyltransferase [Pseudarthrobacter niigatensis]MDQ0264363.1 putative amidophosphoribosyltransferase [Pseudarthrobacter niigatensis]QDG62989.1 ComF family protein [Pseudarthrobacter sp. NIBRBAC000502771]
MNSRSGGGGATGSGPEGTRRMDPDLHPPPPFPALHRDEHAAVLLRLTDWLSGAAADLLALAVPVDCVCCGAEDRTLCASCASRIRRLARSPFRAESGAPALVDVDGTIMLPVVAAGVYRDELAQGLLSFKRHGQHQLRRSLGRALAAAVRAAARDGSGVLLVPVPTGTAAYLNRGFSPVHLLLKEAARQLPGLNVADVLAKKPGPGLLLPGRMGGQKGLGRGARAQRVRGSMRVRPGNRQKVLGRPCIIIDDVLTTGATIGEAARALHVAGAQVRGAVVLAATRPPDASAPATPVPIPHGRSHDLEKNKPGKDE